MKFHVSSSLPKTVDALVWPVEEGKKPIQNERRLPKDSIRELKRELKAVKFTGKNGQSAVLRAPTGVDAKRIVFIGLGKAPIDTEATRKMMATAVGLIRPFGLRTVGISATSHGEPADTVKAAVEGARLADYRFDKYRARSEKSPALELYFWYPTAAKHRELLQAAQRGFITAEAQVLARDLVNEPPSELTPRQLAAEAKKIARRHGLRVTVQGPKQIEKLGMRGYLAVAKGSDEPPRLIKLQYAPARPKKHVVLVGKGITFDAGGLNLKPSRGGMLETMKMDMAGAAAAIGAISAAKALKVPAKVTVYVGATENLLGGSAYKPGDVVKTYNGQTIEIGNTDAEGRVTLADILAYAAKKEKPDAMIDLATLTDTEIALGPDYAALFYNDDRLGKRLKQAGEASGEKLWELPMPDSYDEMTKSKVADFSNIVPNRAYTLSGPLLLKHFVGKTKWAHIDIGGPAWADREKAYWKHGGTGFGVRLLLDYLANP